MQYPGKAVRLSLVGALLFSIITPASAADMMGALSDLKKPEMRVGPLEVHPYAAVMESYDSNIFLQPRSKVVGNNANNNTAGPVLGSWITTLNAGVKAQAKLDEMNTLSLNYDGAWKAYSKDPRSNNTFNQMAGAGYAYQNPMGFSLKVSDNYINTVDPPTSELTQRERRWNNVLAGGAEYGPEGLPLFVGVDGTLDRDKYVANDVNTRQLLDRYNVAVGGTVGYKIQPKTRVYASYHRAKEHFSRGRNAGNWMHNADFGISGEIAPKLKGVIQTGLSYAKYDAATASRLSPGPGGATGIGSQATIFRTWTLGTTVKYQAMEGTDITLALNRMTQDATFSNSNFYIATSGTLGVRHTLPFKLTLGIFGGDEIDKYQESDTITGGNVNLAGVVFSQRNRTDNVYSAGATADYNLNEVLSIALAYGYRARFSHFYTEQFNYQDHTTSLSLSASF